MMEKPPERFWTNDAIEIVANRLGLDNHPRMQDWAYEVADPASIDKYLAFYRTPHAQDDVLFVLADIIIQAFEDLGEDLHNDVRWAAFREDMRKNVHIHAYQIWYWSSFDMPIDQAWHVSPDMRMLWGTGCANSR